MKRSLHFCVHTRCRRNEFQQEICSRADDRKRKATNATKRANYNSRFAVTIIDSIDLLSR
jgi:hypothetical protein